LSTNFRWEPPTDRQRGPRLIREPVRFALVVGGGLAVAGSFVSWADGVLPGGTAVAFSPTTSPDGVILPILAAVGIGLALSEGVAESRIRTLQAALAVVGVIAVLIWISALGSANREIDDWQRQHGTGTIGAGIWLAAAGVALLVVCGTIVSLRAWRTNGAAVDPSDVVVTRRSVARASIEVAGGVAGFIGGIVLGLAIAGPPGLALMALGSMLGGAAGLAAGNRVARLV
jgi:hypothetical protein